MLIQYVGFIVSRGSRSYNFRVIDRPGEERESPQRDGVGRVREKPGEGAEQDEKGGGRHSNLPFDETRNLGGLDGIPRPREFEGAFFRCPDREAFCPAGLLASGSSAAGLLPERLTVLSIQRAQWFRCPGRPRSQWRGPRGIFTRFPHDPSSLPSAHRSSWVTPNEFKDRERKRTILLRRA